MYMQKEKGAREERCLPGITDSIHMGLQAPGGGDGQGRLLPFMGHRATAH